MIGQPKDDQQESFPVFNAGDSALLIRGDLLFMKVKIVGIDPNAYMGSFGYLIVPQSRQYETPMTIHPRYLRPLMRTQAEIRKLFRIVE